MVIQKISYTFETSNKEDMKDLNKNAVYDLRGITEEQVKEVYEWLLKNEPQWHDNGVIGFENKKGIYYDRIRFIFTIPDSQSIHISTLFEEKSLEQELEEAETKVAELKKQIEERDKPKIGDVCKFWDDIENEFIIDVYSELIRIGSNKCVYLAKNYQGSFDNIKKITQQEVIDLLFKNK